MFYSYGRLMTFLKSKELPLDPVNSGMMTLERKGDPMTIYEKRRSIRHYQEKAVEEDKIRRILEAGMQAPSAGNQRPWHFVVVTERERLDALSGMSPYAGMLKQAPLAICVVAKEEGLKYPEVWQQDCAAATENMLLAVAEEELGGVWLGVAPFPDRMERLREILEIPPHHRPFSLLSIGYPAETKAVPDRYDESLIHRETW